MAVNHNIFSQEALDKMRSPEKLDTLLQVTTPIGWMGLVSVLVILFSVVLWSVFGAFTEKADGMGMLLDSAGVATVSHITAGRIDAIYVHSGSRVKKGDLIARMEQAGQTADSRMARYDMTLAQNDREAQSRVSQYNSRHYQEMINENIYSSDDGIIGEVMVQEGSVVAAGAPICTVRRDQKRQDLSGVFYVPVNKGKRIEPGMTMQLSPNGTDTTQNGSLVGVVRSVSQYPISASGLQDKLANSQLSQWFYTQQNSALVEVKFDLVKDESSESGYLWTTVVGKHRPVTAGSFCTGSIIIDRKPPIEKVFYKLSQWLRSR